MTTPTKDLAGLGRLYWSLNDRRRFPTPQVTVEALMFSLRRGPDALSNPNTLDRLMQLPRFGAYPGSALINDVGVISSHLTI